MAFSEQVSPKPPEMIGRWHSVRNAPLQPTDVSGGSRRRVWWQCSRGHEWQAAVYAVVRDDTGCPYCAGKLPIQGETDLAATHPHIARLWHESNELRPTQVSAGSHKKVRWQCERGHIWEASVVSVAIGGSGCPHCAGRKPIAGETDLATQYPDVAAQWDFEKNGGLTPDKVLPSAHDKVWWRCALGHSWQAAVFSRTGKRPGGCPYCTGRKVLAGFNDLGTLIPQLAQEWHPSLNGSLTPAEVSTGSNRRVWWQCGEGHVWQAAVYSRTRRKASGCPICAGAAKQKRFSAQQRAVKKRSPEPPDSGHDISL